MIGEIIVGLVGLSGILGTVIKYRKYLKAIKEVAEVIQVSATALEDGKLSMRELEHIYKEIADVVRIVSPGLLPKVELGKKRGNIEKT